MYRRNILTALTTLAALALGLSLARPACGQAIFYSNLGPNDAYANNIRWNVFGTNLGGPSPAFQFTVPTGLDYPLGRVELPVTYMAGPNVLDVALLTDAGGLPGTVLETFHFVDAMRPFGPNNPLLVGVSRRHPMLEGGASYWLAAFAGTPDTQAGWNFNATGDRSPATFDFFSFSTLYSRHAFRDPGDWRVYRLFGFPNNTFANIGALRVTAVPEPGPLALLVGSGMAGLGVLRRRGAC